MDTIKDNVKPADSTKSVVAEKRFPKPFGRNDSKANNDTNKFFGKGNGKTGSTFKSNGFDRRNTNTKKGR